MPLRLVACWQYDIAFQWQQNTGLLRPKFVGFAFQRMREKMLPEDELTEKEKYDNYAAEMVQRFDDFTKWAIENWPKKNFPLMQSDFNQARKEIGLILGPKLGEGDANRAISSETHSEPQFVDMNPTPWP